MKKLIRITTIPLSLDKLLGKQLSYMNQFFEVTAVSSDEVKLEEVARKYGVKHFCVPMTRTISPLKDLKAVWSMYWFLKKEKPQIVHSHTPKAGIIGMLAAYFAGVPHRYHTVAGLPLLEAKGFKRKVLNFVESLTYYFATKVYPNSFELQKIILKENFCPLQKLQVIGNGSSNGIDTDYFNPDQISPAIQQNLKSQLRIGENDFVFIFVGRLVKDKGINELVAAFKGLNHPSPNIPHPTPLTRHPTSITQHPSFKLLLVGPLEEELDPLLPETLKEIDTNPNIISVGFQEDVRPYFAVSNALVFPSYREGFPNVVLQAGAMGLPSIVTDINGCNEIIEESKNGLIIPVKDTTALQQAMENMVRNTDNYHTMKEHARPMIGSRYRQEVVWQALLEEYGK